MIYEVKQINVDGSSGDTKLYIYSLDSSKEINPGGARPIIVLCPGGGYEMTSDREAEAFAMKFLAMGYHVAILRYSVSPSVYPTALMELAQSVRYLRDNADKYHIDVDKVIVQGSSAGGHLAASLGVFWDKPLLSDALQCSSDDIKPNGMILCYPVISSGEYAHRSSFIKLLGDKYDELVDDMSLENQVTTATPKTFIWHTFPDDSVPVQNSLLFVEALLKHQIPTEFHMYPVGGHGLGLANQLTATPEGYGIQEECQSWMPLVEAWLRNI